MAREFRYLPSLFRNCTGDIPVQANMGAKNHAVLMPDGVYRLVIIRYQRDLHFQANKNLAINSIVGAAFGGRSAIARLCYFYILCSCWPKMHGNFCW